jgi:chromosome segregation ATPase
MKYSKLALLALICVPSFVCYADDSSALYSEVDVILHDVLNSFDGDIALYEQWSSNLDNAMTEFDVMDQNRQTFFDCIRNTISSLGSELESLSVNVDAQDSTIDSLEAQIVSLQANSNQQITSLQDMISTLSLQLQEAEQAYAELSDMSEDKAIALVGSLNQLKQRYYNLVGRRTSFLSSLEVLQDRVRNHFDSVVLDEQSLIALLPEGYDQCDQGDTAAESMETVADLPAV